MYLDYNATTPVDPRVIESMVPAFSKQFGNPSSTTHDSRLATMTGQDKDRFEYMYGKFVEQSQCPIL